MPVVSAPPTLMACWIGITPLRIGAPNARPIQGIHDGIIQRRFQATLSEERLIATIVANQPINATMIAPTTGLGVIGVLSFVICYADDCTSRGGQTVDLQVVSWS